MSGQEETDKEYDCPTCGTPFSSLDDLVDHAKEHHPDLHQLTVPVDNSGEAPPNQQRNPLQIAVENSEETENLVNTILDRWEQIQEGGRSHQRKLTYVAGTLFIFVLLSSTYLTFKGILRGSAYTLLLGTLVGYILTFLDDYL